MNGFSSLECDFVGCHIKNSESVIFKSQLFDGVNGITVKLILSDTQFFKSSIDLKHFSVMNCTFLSNAFVVRAVKVQSSEGTIVPVENTGDTDDSIDIKLVISKVEFLK